MKTGESKGVESDMVSVRKAKHLLPRIQTIAEKNGISSSDILRMALTIGVNTLESLGNRLIIDAVVEWRGSQAPAQKITDATAPSVAQCGPYINFPKKPTDKQSKNPSRGVIKFLAGDVCRTVVLPFSPPNKAAVVG